MSETQSSEELYGVLAEFEDEKALLATAAKVRDAGYRRWDAYAPFPVHGLEKAMGLKPTKLPWLVLLAGLTGGSFGTFLCWWTNGTRFNLPSYLRGYPVLISGKPFFSLPANVPVIFELTILFAALAAVFGMFAFNRLPRLYHPLFRSAKFRRVTRDRFFIAIEAADRKFDVLQAKEILRPLAASVEEVRD